MERVVVIDFETTGLSPAQGDRATEIAAVIVHNGSVLDRYQSLMNAGVSIPSHIQNLTGISSAMVRAAPSAARVMREVFEFVGDLPLVAHNASFDSKFWDAELGRLGLQRQQAFACSMLLSRRILPQAPCHQLAALAQFAGLPSKGRFHRALADAEMAASLLLRLEEELGRQFGVHDVSHALLRRIQKAPKQELRRILDELPERTLPTIMSAH
ncbi:MAG: 3'-5' exonuclease [Zoogloea sp.]|nr:3'-5' exonuclease [Zoogloea sp.]